MYFFFFHFFRKAGVRQTASAPSSCPQSPNLRSTRSPGTIRSIINAVGSKLFTDTGGGFLLDYDDKYEVSKESGDNGMLN